MLIPICLPLRSCLLVSPHSSQPPKLAPQMQPHTKTQKKKTNQPCRTTLRPRPDCQTHGSTMPSSPSPPNPRGLPLRNLPPTHSDEMKHKKGNKESSLPGRRCPAACDCGQVWGVERRVRRESGDGNDFACRSEGPTRPVCADRKESQAEETPLALLWLGLA